MIPVMMILDRPLGEDGGRARGRARGRGRGRGIGADSTVSRSRKEAGKSTARRGRGGKAFVLSQADKERIEGIQKRRSEELKVDNH